MAQHSIFIECYIFEYFKESKELLESLANAQKKGLDVRVILDGFGSQNFIAFELEVFQKMSIPYRIFNPIPLYFLKSNFLEWKRLKQLFSLAKVLKIGNRRNHRKLVLVDSKIAFIGSQNWSIDHIKTEKKPIPWKDIGIKITEDSLEILSRSFLQIWRVSQEKNTFKLFKGYPRLKNHNPMTENFKLNFSFLQRYRVNKFLIRQIKLAKKEIVIGSAYFLPKKSFLRALKRASKRGVQVKLITSGPTDVKIVKLASYELFEKMLKNSISIYEYQKSHFHSKYFLFDETSLLIGSFNMNHRSLMHDLEILFEIKNRQDILDFKEYIKDDLGSSSVVSLDSLKNRSWLEKILSKILYRIRYIL
ncbi:MAG: phosphatidylserine/phosphatidylglycerophosphate/cardiolipin synthase family protein [Bdellovibrionaceae bacterium]|nr:phosphatidylserine/phosphatidylglycerophosphate/cardiolipin synthase family protein [Pseudobdellovibrionaceae bacterium]